MARMTATKDKKSVDKFRNSSSAELQLSFGDRVGVINDFHITNSHYHIVLESW